MLVTFADGIFWGGLVSLLDIMRMQNDAERVTQKEINLKKKGQAPMYQKKKMHMYEMIKMGLNNSL